MREGMNSPVYLVPKRTMVGKIITHYFVETAKTS